MTRAKIRRRAYYLGLWGLSLGLVYLFQNCAPQNGLHIDEDQQTQSSNTYRLRITSTPTNGVITDDDSIFCGMSGTACSSTYEARQTVVLRANPGPNARFGSWGGDCRLAGAFPTCSLTMAKNMSVTANFIDNGSPNPSPLPSATPSPSPAQTPSPSPYSTPSPSPTAAPSPSPSTPSPALSPSPAGTPSPSPTATPSPSPHPTQPQNPPITSVGVGGAHACAVRGGQLFCWGQNGSNELGDGTTTQRQSPVQISSQGSQVTSVPRLGTYTSCAIVSGAAKCWGEAIVGGGTISSPTIVAGLESNVTALAVGASRNACAIKSGSVYCWGANGSGQLGVGNTYEAYNPQQVIGLGGNAQAIAVGHSFACAVVNAGVKCWGDNSSGQLGNYGGQSSYPTPVVGLSDGTGVQRVVAGHFHACAFLASGEIRCWGQNSNGQLGDGTTENRQSPVVVSGFGSGSGANFVTAGTSSTCALKSDGSAWCWGSNNFGQLGDGTKDDRHTPVQTIGAGSGIVSISVDWCSGVAASATTLRTWGSDYYGVLGNGDGGEALTPTAIDLP